MLPLTSPATPTLRLRAWAWRLRLPLLAVALALAGALVVDRLSPAPPPTATVLVTARALPAGTTLGPDDVAPRTVPRALVPDALLPDGRGSPAPQDLVGRRLLATVPAGLPLAPGLLADPEADPPAGTVVVPVRFADPALAPLLRPGSRVDVIAAPPVDGAPAERVARDVLVLDAPGCTDGATPSGQDGAVLLAVPPDQAVALSGASSSAVLSAVIVG